MITLADIIRLYAAELLDKVGSSLLPSHRKTMQHIVKCRTPALGGETWECSECGKLHYSYHSCRNRHCPKCQHDRAELWLSKQQDLLLPAPYFLATVTVPRELRALFQRHQRVLYHILFQAAAQAIMTLARDKKYLGADIGMMGVLHTWKRNLDYHPHIHFLIPGGGVTLDGKRWKYAKPDFLVHVRPLSLLIRRLFREALKETDLYEQVPTTVWRSKWVSHIKSVGDGSAALKYLAPYIMRVALSDKNILNLKDGMVTFRYKDAKTGQFRTRCLPALDFIQQFLKHVLPKGFVKVRYFGFLATKKRDALDVIKELIGIRQDANDEKDKETEKVMRCPDCGGILIFIAELPKRRGPPQQETTLWPSF